MTDNVYATTWCDDIGSEWTVQMEHDYQPYEPATLEYPGCDEEITIGDVFRLEPLIISGVESGESWVLWEGFEAEDIVNWSIEILESIKD